MYIFTELCNPSKFYTIVALLTLLYFIIIKISPLWFALKTILFLIWIFVLNFLCKEKLTSFAWMMAIFPHIVFLLLTLKKYNLPK